MKRLVPSNHSRLAGSPSARLEVRQKYSDEAIQNLADKVLRGKSLNSIAKKLGRGDRKAYMRWYRVVVDMAADPRFEAIMFAATRADLMASLPQVGRNMGRLSRRRVDAGKWVGEATGFHNPRVDHNHQGDIQITMNIPRPVRNQDEAGPVVDADVVEE